MFLNENGIAHRDVRSDNLLINADGYLKLGEYWKEPRSFWLLTNIHRCSRLLQRYPLFEARSSGIRRGGHPSLAGTRSPKVRCHLLSYVGTILIRLSSGPYDASKVDVWSIGATVRTSSTAH